MVIFLPTFLRRRYRCGVALLWDPQRVVRFIGQRVIARDHHHAD
jgi:hypothetical protein